MDSAILSDLEMQAALCRSDMLSMVKRVGSGHLGGSLSVIDMLTYLYFYEMNIRPTQPRWEERDRFVLSKGHCTPAMYTVLASRGFFPKTDLERFRQLDSKLSGHVEMTKVEGVDMSAGSLGQGLSAAIGMALAARINGLDYRVFCIVGDGEAQEGQIWEAAQAASHFSTANLTVFVDNNQIQLDGYTEAVGGKSNYAEKFAAFGWDVVEIDGHDISAIHESVQHAKAETAKPTVIVANTIKGKGVSFMENNPRWHGALPSESEFEVAFSDVREQIEKLQHASQADK